MISPTIIIVLSIVLIFFLVISWFVKKLLKLAFIIAVISIAIWLFSSISLDLADFGNALSSENKLFILNDGLAAFSLVKDSPEFFESYEEIEHSSFKYVVFVKDSYFDSSEGFVLEDVSFSHEESFEILLSNGSFEDLGNLLRTKSNLSGDVEISLGFSSDFGARSFVFSGLFSSVDFESNFKSAVRSGSIKFVPEPASIWFIKHSPDFLMRAG